MKRKTHVILWTILISLLSTSFCPVDNQQPFSVSSDFRFLGRWIDAVNQKFYDTDFYIPVQMSNNIPQTHSWMPEAVENAANEWSNVSGSFFNIQIAQSGPQVYTYNYGTGPILNHSDGVNLIGFNQGDLDFPNPTDENSRLYLAMTHVGIPETQFTDASHTAYTCTQWYHPSFYQADIVINPYANWALIPSQSSSTDDFFDFTTVMKHEFGHLAGIKHFISDVTFVMAPKVRRGRPENFLSSLGDIHAIRLLYGGCDVGQTAFIPCSRFDAGDQFLIAEEDPNAQGEDGCCSGCQCNSGEAARKAQISETALKNIILYGTQNCYWNINKLRRRIVENNSALIEIATSETEYKDAQLAMQNCLEINAALVDATFRCELNVIEKDLTLEDGNINAMITVIDEFLALDIISQGLKDELSKLKQKLPEYEGLNIKEAAILYDAALNN